MREMKIRLGVLLSGSGTTLENFLLRIADGRLDAEVAVVIASRANAYGLVRARNAGIPTRVVARRDYPDVEAFSDALDAALDEFRPDLVTLAGFLSLWKIPPRYEGRVLNIHPALIPAVCGKGFFGGRVHQAVVESGVKVSGCTVHFADNEYDNGPIILQRAVPVHHADTPEDVARKVFAEECEAYPEAIRLFAEGKLRIENGRVLVAD